MAVLSFVVFGVGCDGGDPTGAPAGKTEVNLVILDSDWDPDELESLIDTVSYWIICPASGLTPDYDDSIDIRGMFESKPGTSPPVWELVEQLPPGLCEIAMWVWHEDQVICSGFESVFVLDDTNPLTNNKVDVLLECSFSVKPPGGRADIDAAFEFRNGNYCPQLIWLGAVPNVVDAAIPPETIIQTYSFDEDGTCGDNCDPQTCDFATNPPTCTPGPDLGMVTSTLFAPSGKGSFVDANAFETTYRCDPLFPGPREICVLASDGDTDCDRMRCTTIVCPDLCEGVDCDDGEECTRDRCNPLDGSCSNDNAPDGIACSNCGSTCLGGACQDNPAVPFTADFVANDSTIFIEGDTQSYNATLVNPYSGASVSVIGTFRVNNSTYLGIGTADVLSGIPTGGPQSEVLLLRDLVHPQTVCGVETIQAVNGFDVMSLADDFIVLPGMMIEGGNGDDRLFANAGDDTLVGNESDDHLDGGPGNDMIDGGLGNDTITLWPGSGSDSIWGGMGVDRLEIDAEQNQIQIDPAANPGEFYIFYLGSLMAWFTEVELLVLNDALIDLSTCTGGPTDVCNLCGNDDLNGGEGCDDGNNVSGDGCTAACIAEY